MATLKPKSAASKGRRTIQIANSHGDDVVRVSEPAAGYPTDGTPHSSVAVRFGLRESKPGTYASATMEIEVSIPCNPGEELAAIDAAAELVREGYEKHDPAFQKTVASL